MLLSSGDGWFQRTIALQNHNKLCTTKNTRQHRVRNSHNTAAEAGGRGRGKVVATDLGDARRVRLDERAQPAECRVLLLVVPDLVQRLAPRLCELGQEGRDQRRVHQSDTPDRHSRVLVQAPRCLGVEQDGDQARDEWVHPLLELGVI